MAECKLDMTPRHSDEPQGQGNCPLCKELVHKAGCPNIIDLQDNEVRVSGKQLAIPSLNAAEEAVRTLLRFIGQNPARGGLVDTPKRVVRALTEMCEGYEQDPKKILGRVFEESYDELIISKDIPFTSLCEHHLLVFSGTVDVGYLPGGSGKVVGLSKLARLVDCFSKRLQVQERMTRQVTQVIDDNLKPAGVMVVVRASHLCQSCRGVKKSGSTMVTSSCLGLFRTDSAARAEFLALCGR